MPTAEELIRTLGLQPHPKEGGFFRETYRAAESIAQSALPTRYPAARSASTAIYYLLTPTTYSALHRLHTDEIFHFYLGDPIRMLQLNPDGTGRTLLLGPDVLGGQHLQVVVPSGVWQGSCLEPGGSFALLGCTVAPGFEYADYESGDRATLQAQYPAFADTIQRLTTT
ncbi:MAG TPA: cupin domain-containing protein [Gemmataceae bacterium]|nr:cupin domain-containing protein [Gemmataceae bacterium]